MLEKNIIIKDIIRRIPEIIDSLININISEKSGPTDLVTTADKKVEEYLTREIKNAFPGAEILGEENYDPEKEYSLENLWIIDPIDGTTNFVKKGINYCTIITHFYGGEAVLSYIYDSPRELLYSMIRGVGVFENDKKLSKPKDLTIAESLVSLDLKNLYHTKIGEKLSKNSFGLRIIGSTGLEEVKIATGELGVYAIGRAGPWDFSPCFLLSELFDLHFSDLSGKLPDPTKRSAFLLSTRKIAHELGFK